VARLRVEQLPSALRTLAPVYFISGDEPLLVQECCDSVRKAASSQGFSERELYHTDAGFSWDELYNSANALSLFAEKKLIEIRLHNGKPGDSGSKAIVEYCRSPSEDNLLLLVSPKIDARSQKSAWHQAIDKTGVCVQVWPINLQQMPRWIDQRLKAAGLEASTEAIDILCAKTEGNLLAAIQEIEKLKLITEHTVIDAEVMSTAVMDSARYDVFSLADKAIAGDSRAVVDSLQGLRAEGTEPLTLLWALTREIRNLLSLMEATERGEHFDAAARRCGIWDKRKPAVKSALRRLSGAQLQTLLLKAAHADRAVKGAADGDVWTALTNIALGISGLQLLDG